MSAISINTGGWKSPHRVPGAANQERGWHSTRVSPGSDAPSRAVTGRPPAAAPVVPDHRATWRSRDSPRGPTRRALRSPRAFEGGMEHSGKPGARRGEGSGPAFPQRTREPALPRLVPALRPRPARRPAPSVGPPGRLLRGEAEHRGGPRLRRVPRCPVR